MTTTDNIGNVNYKELQSRRWDLELCGYVTKVDQQVPHATAPTTIASTIVLAITENERNVHKTRKITETLSPVNVVNKHEGCAWNVLQEFADEWTETRYTNNSSTTAQMATSSSGFLLGFSESKEINPSNWNHTDISVLAWGTRTHNYWDDDLNLEMLEIRSVVAHGTTLPAVTPGSFPEQVQVDEARDILTTRQIVGYPTTAKFDRTYVSSIQYSYPALLASWDGDETHDPIVPDWTLGEGWVASFFEEGNARTVFQLIIQLRESFTQDVDATFHEELLTAAEVEVLRLAGENTIAFGGMGSLGTATTRAHIFNPRPRDISYDGLMFTMRVPNVLCDGDTLTATPNEADEYYGTGFTEVFTYPSSNISATEYIALIGEVVCIKDEIKPWKYGLYKRLRVNIPVK